MDGENVRIPINFAYSTYWGNEIADIYIPQNSNRLSVTAVLQYCKHKILNPYLRLLSLMGLRPLICDHFEPTCLWEVLSYAYTFQVVIFMIIGYILQYMACLRRDRGFCQRPSDHDILLYSEMNDIYEATCDGSLLFTFIIPSCLHLVGYISAVVVFRSNDDDQLPVLMERVFLSSTNLSNSFLSQKKLVKTLWIFVFFSVLWMLFSIGSVNYMMVQGNVIFKWMEDRSSSMVLVLKILLVVCTLWHDVIQATIISNYCLQTQLLTSYVQFLREKVLQTGIHPLEWMRDIEDFKKLLNYINYEIAPSVCLFTLANIAYAISGLFWLFNFDHIDQETPPIIGLSILNVFLWILIAVAPFIQAARLSKACNLLRIVGQEVRTRPFVHQDTPSYELDSILLYTSSLKLNAKLYHLPITTKYLYLIFTLSAILLLVLGQLHYLMPKQ